MLDRLNALYPVRYTALGLCAFVALLSLFALVAFGVGGVWFLLFGALTLVGLWDLRQTRSSVLRNYPVIGHLRFMLEFVRPEIRQYFLESDTEAQPFSRAQRSLVYARAKGETDKRPFGTQVDQNATGHEWLNHSMQPSTLPTHDFRLLIGGDACTQWTKARASRSKLAWVPSRAGSICTSPFRPTWRRRQTGASSARKTAATAGRRGTGRHHPGHPPFRHRDHLDRTCPACPDLGGRTSDGAELRADADDRRAG